MPLILSIETATKVCSVALHDNNNLLAVQTLYIDKSHSGLLAPSIESLVSYCGYALSDLNAVAVSEGPGSYTGLRIGVSAAKGLCYALDIPLLSVNTLLALAQNVAKFNVTESLLCPMIDARRMEVYCLLTDHKLNVQEETQPAIVDETFMSELLRQKQVLFFGDGAAKCKNVITSDNAIFLDHVYPDAASVGLLAYEKFKCQQFKDVAYFEPFYLKEFRIGKPKNK